MPPPPSSSACTKCEGTEYPRSGVGSSITPFSNEDIKGCTNAYGIITRIARVTKIDRKNGYIIIDVDRGISMKARRLLQYFSSSSGEGKVDGVEASRLPDSAFIIGGNEYEEAHSCRVQSVLKTWTEQPEKCSKLVKLRKAAVTTDWKTSLELFASGVTAQVKHPDSIRGDQHNWTEGEDSETVDTVNEILNEARLACWRIKKLGHSGLIDGDEEEWTEGKDTVTPMGSHSHMISDPGLSEKIDTFYLRYPLSMDGVSHCTGMSNEDIEKDHMRRRELECRVREPTG